MNDEYYVKRILSTIVGIVWWGLIALVALATIVSLFV